MGGKALLTYMYSSPIGLFGERRSESSETQGRKSATEANGTVDK